LLDPEVERALQQRSSWRRDALAARHGPKEIAAIVRRAIAAMLNAG
jgi:hypothetical protein